MKKYLLVVVGLVGVAAMVVAWNARQNRRDALAARAAVAKKHAGLEAEIASAQTKIIALGREQADLRARLNTLQQSKPAVTAPTKVPSAEASPAAKLSVDARP